MNDEQQIAILQCNGEDHPEVELDVITVQFADWMDDVDRQSRITERVLQWCSRNGYDYDLDYIGWEPA